MNKTRVLVVDDSAFMRKVITDIINSDSDLQVIDRARNGQEAIEKIIKLNPDVVTMDIEMPGLDGLAALKTIMNSRPVPIIMLSSLTTKGAEKTLMALQLGAFDFIAKPSGEISLDIRDIQNEIISKIKIAAAAKSKLGNFASDQTAKISSAKAVMLNNKTARKANFEKIILIGTSTGGPKALYEVLPQFPPNLEVPVLVVQHMPPNFTRSLAERLNAASAIKVKEAEHGEEILPGYAYIAPGDLHLHVNNNSRNKLAVSLNTNPPRRGHRPSVNEMFESVANNFKGDIIAVIMTGMGNDGTEGLKAIKEGGGFVIAEHPSTCIVYGMPRAAVESGRVDKIVPLKEITSEILKAL